MEGMMTWTVRPPQHHFDGSDARNAILSQRQAEYDANPDCAYWKEKADRYAAKCSDLMGLGYYRAFMADYANETFEQHTWKEQAEAYMRLHVALMGPSRDIAALRQAFGWQYEAVTA